MQDSPHITLSAPHRRQQWTLTYGTGTNIPDEDMKSAKPTRTHAQRKKQQPPHGKNNLTPRQIKGYRLHTLHKVKDTKNACKMPTPTGIRTSRTTF